MTAGADVFAAVLGPDLEAGPIDTERVSLNLGAAPEKADRELRFALSYGARLHWLSQWRSACGRPAAEQRLQLDRLFDAVFQASSTGRFTAFEQGREERRRRWSTRATRRVVDRLDDFLLPATDQFNARARQRRDALRALLDDDGRP
jgi:hypothetical protein